MYLHADKCEYGYDRMNECMYMFEFTCKFTYLYTYDTHRDLHVHVYIYNLKMCKYACLGNESYPLAQMPRDHYIIAIHIFLSIVRLASNIYIYIYIH